MEAQPQPPKSDFLQIVSSVHNQPVIMTRIDPSHEDRFFISVQDVIDGTAGDRSTLQTYEEFCNYLAQPNIMPNNEEEKLKAHELVKNKKHHIMQFRKKIDDEKLGVKRLLSDRLQELYRNKCSELVDKLQNELDGQNQLFTESYDKLTHEINADREKEAGLTKYEEIQKKVKELNNPVEIENYLQNVYKNKKTWKTASENIQTLGQRTEEFYKNIIDKQLANSPTLANVDKLIQTWVGGLDKLISQVKADANVFKNMLCSCHLFVPLEINNLKEFTLITNEMIKPDTQLQIKLAGQILTEQDMESFTAHLAKLTNIVHLVFDINGGVFPAQCVEQFIKPFEHLKKLGSIHIKAYGTKLGDSGVQQLAKLLAFVPHVFGLNLELGENKITSTGLALLSDEFTKLTKLQCLSLQMEKNPIKVAGFATFQENLSKILPTLVQLRINFDGCTDKSKVTPLDLTISCALVQLFKKATLLKSLYLELGNNQIEKDFVKELAMVLPELVSLQELNIDLNNNKLTLQGANKLAKLLMENKFSKLNLNLSGNDIKVEGAKCIIDAIKQMNLLTHLTLNIRNTGIKKGLATQMKTDLEVKSGLQFEKFEFLA